MKKLKVILLTGCLVVISQGFRGVAANQGDLLLNELAGTYSLTAHGSLTFCLGPTPPFAPVKCGSKGARLAPNSILDVGASTVDTIGNSCATFTQTNTDRLRGAFPPAVVVISAVSTVTSYDPTTGTGDGNFTGYLGGKCKGATFDSTHALPIANGTYHFTASHGGQRFDFLLKSLTNPVGVIGSFSVSGTLLRQ